MFRLFDRPTIESLISQKSVTALSEVEKTDVSSECMISTVDKLRSVATATAIAIEKLRSEQVGGHLACVQAQKFEKRKTNKAQRGFGKLLKCCFLLYVVNFSNTIGMIDLLPCDRRTLLPGRRSPIRKRNSATDFRRKSTLSDVATKPSSLTSSEIAAILRILLASQLQCGKPLPVQNAPGNSRRGDLKAQQRENENQVLNDFQKQSTRAYRQLEFFGASISNAEPW